MNVNLNTILYCFREILASPNLLNVQNRIDWRKCVQTEDEETLDVKMFRIAFAPHNPIKD